MSKFKLIWSKEDLFLAGVGIIASLALGTSVFVIVSMIHFVLKLW